MHRSITFPLSRLRTRRARAAGSDRSDDLHGPRAVQGLGPDGGQPVCDCAQAAGRAAVEGRHLRAVPPREAGITTAEYAVGTAAGAGLAGLLYTMLSGGFGDQLLTTLFDHVLGLLGVG